MTPARPDEIQAACEVLFPGSPDKAARALGLIQSGELDPQGLLVVRDGGRITGAILYELHAGSSAVVWPPGASNAATRDALARAVVERLRAARAKQAQTLLQPAEISRAEPLLYAGFRHVARLSLQVRTIDFLEVFDPPTSELAFQAANAQTPGFPETLEATYEGTLDCPELNGVRDIHEVLLGYARFPPSDPAGWFLVSRADERVGVVLLGPGSRPGIVELSYLGLVPAARGRKFARHLLQFVLRQAADRFAECVTLSVDLRNAPALQLYFGQGFRQYDQQDVYLWCSAPAGSQDCPI